jgi:hypothetical protein
MPPRLPSLRCIAKSSAAAHFHLFGSRCLLSPLSIALIAMFLQQTFASVGKVLPAVIAPLEGQLSTPTNGVVRLPHLNVQKTPLIFAGDRKGALALMSPLPRVPWSTTASDGAVWMAQQVPVPGENPRLPVGDDQARAPSPLSNAAPNRWARRLDDLLAVSSECGNRRLRDYEQPADAGAAPGRDTRTRRLLPCSNGFYFRPESNFKVIKTLLFSLTTLLFCLPAKALETAPAPKGNPAVAQRAADYLHALRSWPSEG